MSSLAKQLSGQHQKGVKNYAKGGPIKNPRSASDDDADDAPMIGAKKPAKGKKKGGKCC